MWSAFADIANQIRHSITIKSHIANIAALGCTKLHTCNQGVAPLSWPETIPLTALESEDVHSTASDVRMLGSCAQDFCAG